jgi:hypothetical protein
LINLKTNTAMKVLSLAVLLFALVSTEARGRPGGNKGGGKNKNKDKGGSGDLEADLEACLEEAKNWGQVKKCANGLIKDAQKAGEIEKKEGKQLKKTVNKWKKDFNAGGDSGDGEDPSKAPSMDGGSLDGAITEDCFSPLNACGDDMKKIFVCTDEAVGEFKCLGSGTENNPNFTCGCCGMECPNEDPSKAPSMDGDSGDGSGDSSDGDSGDDPSEAPSMDGDSGDGSVDSSDGDSGDDPSEAPSTSMD